MSIGEMSEDRLRAQPGIRLVALVACVLIAVWVAQRPGVPTRPDPSALPNGADQRATARQPRTADALALVPAPRATVAPGALFAPPRASPATDPPTPAPSIAAAATPALTASTPAAPALPFTLIGRLRAVEGWTVLLSRSSAQYVASTGDVVEGEWRVDTIDETGVQFVYLRLGTRHRLPFTAAEPPGLEADAVDALARVSAHAAPARASAAHEAALAPEPGNATGGVAGIRDRPAAPAPGGSVSGAAEAPRPPPRDFERRVRPSDIPREPWVCEAARANALLPCRNTWSMSEAERVACRQAADGRYNTCLSTALRAAESEN